MTRHDPATAAAAGLWHLAGLPADALWALELSGREPVLPTSFRLTTAALASIGTAALAAVAIGAARGGVRQQVAVDAVHATLECTGSFRLDGRTPEVWDKLSGLYPCGGSSHPGHVRIHANFAYHRDAALTLLGLPTGAGTMREQVASALADWRAEDFEDAAAKAGAVVAAARSFAQWDAHPQAAAVSALPVFSIERLEGGGSHDAAPRVWPDLPAADAPPLHGLKVLDLTRILAGPVAGRALAAYGADVMLVNGPHLPNIEHIADTSRGKRSVHIDLRDEAGRATLRSLIADSHVFIQGYRPGALAAQGFAPEALATLRPGSVVVSLSAYSHVGPWAGRRGFDSLVQTATGFNHAEGAAAGSQGPKAWPCQMIDYASGYLMALAAQAALWRQQREGGSWHVRVSLAQTAHWIRSLGRIEHGFDVQAPSVEPFIEESDSGFGRLAALRHPATFSHTTARWSRPSVPPGHDAPRWQRARRQARHQTGGAEA
jgi:hypothetical protein